MGIKGLWSVLTPYSEKKSLHEIQGETVAVDLAGWICDSQNVTDYHIQPKLYLRNLFFRTVYLLLGDVNPIFVLEGDAPELKRDVMATRNAIQFRGAAPKTGAATSNKKPDVCRKRFKGVLKECESLLKCMGVRCVKGKGEAEATCAQLNAQGLVDAVISQDSDCFAYGARRVYRNFSVSSAAGGGALQGSVECYDVDKMIEDNGFGRNKMIALALLCGCDYGAGACGSSIITAVSFLHTVPDSDIIPRLLSWVTDPQDYESKARWVAVPGRCDRCGHGGKSHGKNGCPVCVTARGCEDTGHKTKLAEVKKELSLRNRALNCGAPFPEPKVMKEFLNVVPDKITLRDLRQTPPSLIQFIKLMKHKLDWSERYCVEKFLPVLTKFHLQRNVPTPTIKPVRILKKRMPRGVPSFEVVWNDVDAQYDGLIPDDQFEEGEDPQSVWTTTEKQDLMRQYYPDIVEAYEESIKKPVKEKKQRQKKTTDQEGAKPKRKYTKKRKDPPENKKNDTNKSLQNTSKLNVSVKVNKLKRKQRNIRTKNQKTIDSFIENKKRRISHKLVNSLRCSFKNLSLNNDDEFNVLQNKLDSNKENLHSKSLSILDLSDDESLDHDLSDIVDAIVKKAPTSKTTTVNNNLVKLIFRQKHSTPRKSCFRKSILNEVHQNCSTPISSPKCNRKRISTYQLNISNNSLRSKVNTSYFFDKLTEERDAFEVSIDLQKDEDKCDNDVTVEYSISDTLGDSLPKVY